MIEAGVEPDVVTYNTLIAAAKEYEQGRAVFDEMIEAGVEPDELTHSTLVSLVPEFESGCDLARELSERSLFCGLGFYSALFARPVLHLTSMELLAAYQSLPFRFEKSLQNPIRQYVNSGRLEDAIQICLFSPHLQSAQKFYKDSYEFCFSYLENLEQDGEDSDNFHYCFGIVSFLNDDFSRANKHLRVALERAYATARIDHISCMLKAIPEIEAEN